MVINHIVATLHWCYKNKYKKKVTENNLFYFYWININVVLCGIWAVTPDSVGIIHIKWI